MIDNIPEWIIVPLTADQIKNASTTPIDAIPAPGVGKAIEILSNSMRLTFGSVAFTSTSLRLITETAASIQGSASGLNSSSSVFVKGSLSTSTTTQLVENKKMQITANADSAVGDSTVKFYILYRIVTI